MRKNEISQEKSISINAESIYYYNRRIKNWEDNNNPRPKDNMVKKFTLLKKLSILFFSNFNNNINNIELIHNT